MTDLWQPIETAPVPTSDDGWNNWTDNFFVLVYDPKIGARSAYAQPILKYPDGTHGKAILTGFEWWTGEPFDSDLLHPTHWIPLPPPPASKELE